MTDNLAQEESPLSEMPAEASVQVAPEMPAPAGSDEAIVIEDVTSLEELEQLYEESLKHIQEGEIVRGRVVMVGRDSVLVDVGYKSEGMIDLDEFPDRGRDLRGSGAGADHDDP